MTKRKPNTKAKVKLCPVCGLVHRSGSKAAATCANIVRAERDRARIERQLNRRDEYATKVRQLIDEYRASKAAQRY